MAPGLVRVEFPRPNTRGSSAAGPAQTHAVVFAGLAARAWETPARVGILSAYVPASWHHPVGVAKVVKRLKPRLPNVSGCLFLTLTIDPLLFADPATAFETTRPLIRKLFAKLRQGADWEGKRYQLLAPYCVKVEFHENGWAHFHLIVLTRKFLPGELLNELWGFGRCHVERISNQNFDYLLKYTTKGGGYPEWVLSRKRLRVFQPSHGFMVAPSEAKRPANPKRLRKKRQRASYTIGQRLLRWERQALFNQRGQYRTVMLGRPFQELFDQHVLSIAEDDRYLGNGFVKVNKTKEIIPWLIQPQLK